MKSSIFTEVVVGVEFCRGGACFLRKSFIGETLSSSSTGCLPPAAKKRLYTNTEKKNKTKSCHMADEAELGDSILSADATLMAGGHEDSIGVDSAAEAPGIDAELRLGWVRVCDNSEGGCEAGAGALMLRRWVLALWVLELRAPVHECVRSRVCRIL